ncbi:glutaredoxin family protein [Anaerosalibacter massiliensis]|uniref:Glutaredoxin family protein n=1 Tax=Anaerosalibacter massiliensis TaxID=1347392 RepID=A0A9X2MNF4_9FIRM|nr:glutaredoxin family protein [Anaerosalibacter massiliensis]MCR2044226.1 glutaredoxin family protein [Anaerosalibacter massiliensis]
MKNITIYTANACPYCIKTKEYFLKKGIKYDEKNVQENSQAKQELLSMGYRTVPVILIDDEEIVGFDKSRIDRAIG